ncbi:periplasmic nitrate reductase, NapE protein [Pseudoruegeria sp. SHC-113]|uniref:periplasmic nitrate reductase, NapE protein n=1 Tax=Pseudoruegeria sp. SHC-113 TaxID=2855439 RepID=UPI0021BAF18E|nr:periplasmic nitrate reductase, NapE protein [Pseudoruegeria sp. SHC-113]MCT8161903.1 periplasmic nitrate reductase, NapE protein [Pseudoruegeria sp. SHC-113]
MATQADPKAEAPPKSSERLAVFLLVVVMAPVLSVGIVGGWGFFIWMMQLIFGPPGAH